jgi:ketosteroid isomerase-like protein
MTSGDRPAAEEIRTLLEARLEALRAKDAGRFLAAFDPSIVKFDLAPPLRESGPGVLDAAGLEWWLDTWEGDLLVDLAELAITADGSVAFCHFLEHFQGTRTGGEQADMWTRSTVGLKKIDGAWKITHEHNSVPSYMDGEGRAALDLRP